MKKTATNSSKVKAEKLADKWIEELKEAGFTYDEMLLVFKEARRQFENYKKRKK